MGVKPPTTNAHGLNLPADVFLDPSECLAFCEHRFRGKGGGKGQVLTVLKPEITNAGVFDFLACQEAKRLAETV